MFKQVIVVNKRLDMSPGKLGAMVAHGATSFFCEWFKRNVTTSYESYNDYSISTNARIGKELFAQWISGSFTKIVLEVKDESEMTSIIKKAHEHDMVNGQDFFNIVDESTEFLDIPQWAVIAFRPMKAEKIDLITGKLNLYSKDIPDIKEISGKFFENIHKVTTYHIDNWEKDKEYYFLLVTDNTEIPALSGYYRWVNLSSGSVLKQTFKTKEKAVEWAAQIRNWEIENIKETLL